MRHNRNVLAQQRHRLDQLLKELSGLEKVKPPRSGWLKSVREALGLGAPQLAKRMKLKTSTNIFKFEKGEIEGTITLQNLKKAADAMNCRLVYALVPNAESLESLLDEQAAKAAKEIMNNVSHTMRLENQQTSRTESKIQEEKLARELKEKLDLRIWSK